jgi:hypothetical protein
MRSFLTQIKDLESSPLATGYTRLEARRVRRQKARELVKNSQKLTKEKAG